MPFPNPATQFKPGNKMGPGRAPNAGSTVLEWKNTLASYSEAELQKISKDKTVGWAKKTAARRMLNALKQTRLGMDETGQIIDYTNGKATQPIEHRGLPQPPLAALLAEMSPEERAVLRARITGRLASAQAQLPQSPETVTIDAQPSDGAPAEVSTIGPDAPEAAISL